MDNDGADDYEMALEADVSSLVRHGPFNAKFVAHSRPLIHLWLAGPPQVFAAHQRGAILRRIL